MIILEERDRLVELVEEKTRDRVRSSRDYVVSTRKDDILMSFRWMDSSKVLLYMNAKETTLWADNPTVREMAQDIKGTGKEELFSFLLILATDDLNKLDKFDDRIIKFEEKLFDGKNTQENFQSIHRLRKEGSNKRRYFERMDLLTNELKAIDTYYTFLDDKYDKLLNHILRTQEYLDQIRQSYEAQISIEQNNLMKFFTVVTSIFLPLSLIAGWYGMNLMMPEFQWIYSYPFVITMSIAIIVVLLWFFRKNKWI